MAILDINSTIGLTTAYFGEYVAGDLSLGLVMLFFAVLAFFLAFRLPAIMVLALTFPLLLTFLLVSSAPAMVTLLGVVLFSLSVFMARSFFAQ
jgi:hypothetical protein